MKQPLKNVTFEDTTLRDGEQTPRVAFSTSTKIAIHDELIACGVRWIEAGIPAMGGDELDALKQLLARGSDAVLVAWNRGVRSEVEFSLDLGFRAVHIGLPTSDVHLRSSVRRDRPWLLERATDLVKYAKDRGAFVSISAEDIGRTERSFLQEYAGRVSEAGADRLRLSDTIGMLGPESYGAVVRDVREACNIDIQCHAHNDFGLALANTLAGIQSGATWFHATVNGIGERAGMTDLAQAAMALRHLYGVDIGIKTERLNGLSRLVAASTKSRVPPWQPVVGDNVFAHESGIHANAMLRDDHTFEPFQPEDVGGRRQYVVGKHSGRGLVRWSLDQLSLSTDEESLTKVLEEVRATAVSNGTEVTDEELVEIWQRVGMPHESR